MGEKVASGQKCRNCRVFNRLSMMVPVAMCSMDHISLATRKLLVLPDIWWLFWEISVHLLVDIRFVEGSQALVIRWAWPWHASFRTPVICVVCLIIDAGWPLSWRTCAACWPHNCLLRRRTLRNSFIPRGCWGTSTGLLITVFLIGIFALIIRCCETITPCTWPALPRSCWTQRTPSLGWSRRICSPAKPNRTSGSTPGCTRPHSSISCHFTIFIHVGSILNLQVAGCCTRVATLTWLGYMVASGVAIAAKLCWMQRRVPRNGWRWLQCSTLAVRSRQSLPWFPFWHLHKQTNRMLSRVQTCLCYGKLHDCTVSILVSGNTVAELCWSQYQYRVYTCIGQRTINLVCSRKVDKEGLTWRINIERNYHN